MPVPSQEAAISLAASHRPDDTPGRCTNLDYCSIGMHRQMVAVPLGQPFVCPECGKPLRPPGLRGLQRPVVLPALRVIILCLGIVAGGLLGYRIGRSMPPPPPAATHPAAPPLAPASPPTLPTIAAQPHAQTVRLRPFPAHPPAPDIADPPQRLPHEQRYGQIILDCVFIAARATATCHTGDVRGSDAFSTSANTWLQTLLPLYPTATDHRWRVIIEDFAGQSASR